MVPCRRLAAVRLFAAILGAAFPVCACAQHMVGEVASYGRVLPGERIVTLAMPYYQSAPQIVGELAVKEGETVEKGRRLALSHNHALALADLAQAQAQLRAKQENLKLVREGMKAEEIAAQESMAQSLEFEAAEAKKRLDRLSQLRINNAAPEQDLDEAFAKARSLELRLAMNQHTLEAMRTVRPTEVAVAEAAVAEAEGAVKRAQALLATTEVLAPTKGTVLKVLAYPGEQVEGGLLEFGDTGAMLIKAEMNVADATLVRVGAKVRAKSEAWQGEVTGVVSRISPLVQRSFLAPPSTFSTVDRRIVEVTVALDKPDQLAALSGAEATVYIAAGGRP